MSDNTEKTAPEKQSEKEEKPRKRRRRLWLWILLGFLGLFVLGGYGFYEYSNTPGFCNSCHIMEPYYKAWEESTHGDVPCVDCHIPPEEGAKWKAKVNGMMQALKYMTRTYASKPYAEIEDESCLRSGCHDQRLVTEHSTETFKNNVMFDHAPHLKEPRRGKRLRCTSCHAQIVVGNHMEVTTTTCYLCHFRESDKHDVEQLSECRQCHKKLPDQDLEHEVRNPAHPDVVVETVTFNHADYIGDRNVNCLSCHSEPFRGQGDAHQERCFVCHNDPSHIERIGEIEFIHDNHITEHNVTCERCHDPIQHEAQSSLNNLGRSCNFCHEASHNGQQQMYMGIGGKGVEEDMPSSMFSAMIDCSGCHIGTPDDIAKGPGFTGLIRLVDYNSCVLCHGEDADGYIEIFNDYSTEVKERLDEVKALIRSISPSRLNEEDKALYTDAMHNIEFVDKSHGWAHNPDYSLELLDYAESNLEEIANK